MKSCALVGSDIIRFKSSLQSQTIFPIWPLSLLLQPFRSQLQDVDIQVHDGRLLGSRDVLQVCLFLTWFDLSLLANQSRYVCLRCRLSWDLVFVIIIDLGSGRCLLRNLRFERVWVANTLALSPKLILWDQSLVLVKLQLPKGVQVATRTRDQGRPLKDIAFLQVLVWAANSAL